MMRAEEEILTVDDLARLFGCDKETAAARLTSGDMPGVKVGRGWIIPRQAFFARLNEKAL
jgi:excisionase family DNA binding protein